MRELYLHNCPNEPKRLRWRNLTRKGYKNRRKKKLTLDERERLKQNEKLEYEN